MGNGGNIHWWWNSFDVQIVLFLNQFAGVHPRFDSIVSWCDETPLAKGGVIVSLIWLVLFDRNRSGELRDDSELLLGGIFFSAFAATAARGLAIVLPFRTRPLATPMFHFRVPVGGTLDFIDWSSFPSDHAAMFFALATAILLVSRRAGWFAIAWTALVICIPRMYMGQHWPTDVIAGATMGVSSTQLARVPAIRNFVRRTTTEWHRNYAGAFFALLFLWSYETVNLFGDVRHVLKIAARLI